MCPCSFFKLLLRTSLYVATTFLFSSCCSNVSYTVSISVATRKVYRDRVLLPLNLISCCSFILILQHSLLVLSMFAVATHLLCRDKTFIYSTHLCVATRFVVSLQDFSSLCWNLFHDIEKSIATLRSQFILSLCHDLKIPVAASKHLFSLKHVATLDSFVVTKSVH